MSIVSFDEFIKQSGGTAKDIKMVEPPQATFQQEPGLFSRISKDVQGAGAGVEEAISGTGRYAGRSTLGRAVGATAEAFGAIPKVATELLPQPARKGLEKVGEVAGGAVNLLADKVSDIDALQKWVTENPEAARKLEDIAGIGQSAGVISGSILTADIASKGITKGGEATTKIAKSSVKTIGDLKGKITPDATQIMQRVARVSKGKQANFERMAGENIGTYLDKRGIYGNIEKISEKLYQRFTASKSQADKAFAQVPGQFKPISVDYALKGLLERESKVSLPGVRSMDYTNIKTLADKFNREGLTMPEINMVKRLYERNVKLDYIKQNLPESVAKANNIDSALRNWQLGEAAKAGIKNIKFINKETQLAKQLLDDIGKEYAGSAANNMVTLTDWIVLAGGDPTAIAAFLVKKGFSMKETQSWIAKNISKTEKIPLPKVEVGVPKKGFTELGK